MSTPRETNLEDLTIIEVIGEGGMGIVYKATINKTGETVALKRIKLPGKENFINNIQEAIIHLKLMKSAFICQLKTCYIKENEKFLYMILEYCEGGDLKALMKKYSEKKEPMPMSIILKIFLQILMALQFLHSKKIIHRDLKPENILFTKGGVVKLADFGISKEIEGSKLGVTKVGTFPYEAPEVIDENNKKEYGFEVDVWALGIILYEMVTGEYPFNDSDKDTLVKSIIYDDYKPIKRRVNKNIIEIIDMMLQKNPKKRPSVKEILEGLYAKNLLPNKRELDIV